MFSGHCQGWAGTRRVRGLNWGRDRAQTSWGLQRWHDCMLGVSYHMRIHTSQQKPVTPPQAWASGVGTARLGGQLCLERRAPPQAPFSCRAAALKYWPEKGKEVGLARTPDWALLPAVQRAVQVAAPAIAADSSPMGGSTPSCDIFCPSSTPQGGSRACMHAVPQLKACPGAARLSPEPNPPGSLPVPQGFGVGMHMALQIRQINS